jgi:acetate kinase
MKILVLNCGSSSIKYKLYNMDDKSVIAAGGIEKVGLNDSFLKIKQPVAETITTPVPTHDVGVELIFNILTDPVKGVIGSLDEINAVGHRIAHGGKFTKSLELTPEVLTEWKKYEDLAPLHNPAHLKGINAVTAHLPKVKQVGVFDTSFHQTMPDYAYNYALPRDICEQYGIRRYGFHGTSHRYVLARAAELYGFRPEEKNVITCHIGNGASIAAIKQGRCVDTSMGLTPLEGLIMGTRTGDLDPSAVLFLQDKLGLSTHEVSNLLNKQSGMLGITGRFSDMREILAAAAQGDSQCQLAVNMYNYRIRKYVCAYAGIMGGVDYIIFTAGVGENQYEIRGGSMAGLEHMGIIIDPALNKANRSHEGTISTADSRVTVCVIPTDEELLVASDTMEIVKA